MAREMNREALEVNLRMLDRQGEIALETARAEDPALAAKLQRIGELYRDEAFVKAFVSTGSCEEAAALFRANGLELTEQEVTAIARQLRDTAQKLFENGGELSEDELAEIAGGKSALKYIGGGAAAGAIIMGGLGTAMCPGFGTAVGGGLGALFGAVAGFFAWL